MRSLSLSKGYHFLFVFFLLVFVANGRAASHERSFLPVVDPARLLSEYVQIPSVTGHEKEAGEFFSAFCRAHGLHVRVFTDAEDSYNFAASLYPLSMGKPNIVLLTHIDVVPEGDADGWTHPPYSGQIADGMVWGRGAIDNKAMGVMQVLAMLHFIERAATEDLPYNVTMLAVSGEETGGYTGARIIVDEFLDELNPVVVYGEGGSGVTGVIQAQPETTIFGVEISQKRVLWIALDSSVPSSGHGSIPRKNYPTKDLILATNALLEARPTITLSPPVRNALMEIGEYERGIRGLVLRRIDFFGPLFGRTLRQDPLIAAMITNTISLTGLTSTPGAYNQIPTNARAVFDCRLLPETDEEKFLDHVRRLVAPYEVNLEVIRSSPGSPITELGPYFEVLEAAVLDTYDNARVMPMMFVATNDNRFFRQAGIPAYGLLPNIMTEELLESIHYFDERFPVDALYDGIQVYIRLIERLFDKHPEAK